MKSRLLLFTLVFLLTVSNIATYAEEMNIVNTKALYDSKSFVADVYSLMDKLHEVYPSITRIEVVGNTVEGRDIRIFRVGKGKKEIFINAAHHGKEYMTTILAMQQIEVLLKSYKCNAVIDYINIKNLLDEVSIVFMPLVNPDGVSLAKHGLNGTLTLEYIKNIIPKNKKTFSDWKANGRGVDLNRNYDTIIKDNGDTASKAGPRNYPGLNPFTEPETQAIKKLCETHDFELVIAYHSAGQIIYWYYFQETAEQESRDHKIAQMLSKLTNYKLVPKTANPGGGGMKDWFVQTYKKPGFTIEIGREIGEYKILKYTEYPQIWEENSNVPIYLANMVSTTLNPRKPEMYDIKDESYRELLKSFIEKEFLFLESDKYGNRIFNGARVVNAEECIRALKAAYSSRLQGDSENESIAADLLDKISYHLSGNQIETLTYMQCLNIIFNIESAISATQTQGATMQQYIQTNELNTYDVLNKHTMAYLLRHIVEGK